MPYGVEVSDDCRDLLLHMLQRDPDQRISFEDFFNHPFVDLQHIPSNSSLNNAVRKTLHSFRLKHFLCVLKCLCLAETIKLSAYGVWSIKWS